MIRPTNVTLSLKTLLAVHPTFQRDMKTFPGPSKMFTKRPRSCGHLHGQEDGRKQRKAPDFGFLVGSGRWVTHAPVPPSGIHWDGTAFA